MVYLKRLNGYITLTRKTTIEIDEELFQRARNVLGTHGLKATVQRAFEEILALDARCRAIEQLQTMSGLDLDNADIMATAWR